MLFVANGVFDKLHGNNVWMISKNAALYPLRNAAFRLPSAASRFIERLNTARRFAEALRAAIDIVDKTGVFVY
jgi:hypothetical protein